MTGHISKIFKIYLYIKYAQYHIVSIFTYFVSYMKAK